jgi:DNA-binding NtrC family response regulator
MENADFNLDNVRPLRRLRVLVATRDRRFLRVAGFLLARGEFEVESTSRPRDLLRVIERQPPDIVILDASESLAEAARCVAAAEALHPHVTVLVVSDDDAAAASTVNLRAFDKWKSFEQVVVGLRELHFGRRTVGPPKHS